MDVRAPLESSIVTCHYLNPVKSFHPRVSSTPVSSISFSFGPYQFHGTGGICLERGLGNCSRPPRWLAPGIRNFCFPVPANDILSYVILLGFDVESRTYVLRRNLYT